MATNRLAADKQVSYIRNSVKATVDAYDGTVTLYALGPAGPDAEGVEEGVPGTVKPISDIAPELQSHLRYPEDLFKVQRAMLGQVPRHRPGDVLLDIGLLGRAARSESDGRVVYQPPYYIVAKDIARNDSSASFQLTSAMNRFKRDFLAAWTSVPAPIRTPTARSRC